MPCEGGTGKAYHTDPVNTMLTIYFWKMKTGVWLGRLYLLSVAAVCMGELFSMDALLWAKVAAMPILLGWLYAVRGSLTPLILLILIASWAGDVLLIFAPDPDRTHSLLGIKRQPHFFLLGLVSFLIAQLGYIRAYIRRPLPSPRGMQWWVFLLIGAYAMLFTAFLWSRMQDMEKAVLRLPVAVYAAALAGMAISVATQKGYIRERLFRQVFFGALLFVLSDSLIGLNYLALDRPLWGAGAMIFLTYGAAQWLLAQGLAEKA